MAQYLSLQMTPPTYPVSGPIGDGRTGQYARGEVTPGTTTGVPAVLANGDTVVMFRCHRNFRVMGGFIKTPALGASTTLQLGDAGDDDRYFTATSSASATTIVTLADTGRDYLIPAMTPIILKLAGASASSAPGTIVVTLHGIIENPA